jgi:hypothetical protein
MGRYLLVLDTDLLALDEKLDREPIIFVTALRMRAKRPILP